MKLIPRRDRAATYAGRSGPIIRSALAGLAAVSLLALAASQPAPPALAQKSETAQIDTPFGRAPMTFADIVEKVKPAVVSISVTNGGKVASRDRGGNPLEGIPGMPDLPDDHPLNEFFKNLPKDFRGGPQTPQQPRFGEGSGFVISPDGYVVTNNHVIDGASKIEVSFDDQEKLDADLVGTDQRTDLALLKIKATAKTYPYVEFSDKPARVGDWVLAVGNPFGLGGSVTAGILSAQARNIGSGPYDYIQVDAAVNRGNSGGPTFNLDGKVIGVNTAIYSPSGGNVGIAFAVPATTAKDVVAALKKDGTVSRGWLGVKIQDVEADIAASIGLDPAKGALVTEVMANTPAGQAGLKTRDAIIAVNGTKIENSRDLARKIADFAPDTTVDVKVWRGNGEQTVPVKLGRFPANDELAKADEPAKPTPAKSTPLDQLGLSLDPAKNGSGEGVAIAEVDPDSDAAVKGLKAGDSILNVNDRVVTSPEDIASEVKKASDLGRRAVLLAVKSGDQTRYVGVQLKKS